MAFDNPFQNHMMDEKQTPQQQGPFKGQDVVDRGRKAWTFLAAAAATNIITYGKNLVFLSPDYIGLSANAWG
jgi:hypothetical protein